jgi:Zn-dependent M28 family amino/carboxypeptidase
VGAVLLVLVAACSRPPAPHPPVAVAASTVTTPAPVDPERVLAFTLARSLSDQVGPRLAGSPGDARAVAWALREMKRLGLTDVHAEPVAVPVWERGAESCEIVEPAARRLVATALGWSVPTPPEGITAEVIEVASLEEGARLTRDVAGGKIVFYNIPMAPFRDGRDYGRVVPVRSKGPVLAEKAGALAVLVRSVGTDHARRAHTGSMGRDSAKIPTAAISVPDAESLHRLLVAGPVRVRLSLETRTRPDAESANVVGEVRGTRDPGRLVLAGAHLDAWDLGTGSVDDGAGVGLVLAAAHAFTRSPPARTVRVVLFAAEENSGAGGKAYVKAHEPELGRHVAAIEMDAGTGRVYEARVRGGAGAAGAFAALRGPLAALGVEIGTEPAGGGADTGLLRAAGVPAIDLRQDATAYFDVHHTVDDLPEALDPAGLDQATRALEAVLGFAAREEVDLGRLPLDAAAK